MSEGFVSRREAGVLHEVYKAETGGEFVCGFSSESFCRTAENLATEVLAMCLNNHTGVLELRVGSEVWRRVQVVGVE